MTDYIYQHTFLVYCATVIANYILNALHIRYCTDTLKSRTDFWNSKIKYVFLLGCCVHIQFWM